MKTNLNEISKAFHENAKAKGFWDEKREIGTLLMLVVSELSEALEADRKGYHAFDVFKNGDFKAMETALLNYPNTTWPIESISDFFKKGVQDSFEDEIADTFIRLFDLVGYLGIDIDKHIELKVAYNSTREYKHGKKY